MEQLAQEGGEDEDREAENVEDELDGKGFR